MYPGYTPRTDGFRGDSIGAIHAAQQQRYAPSWSPPEDRDAVRREAEKTRARAAEAAAARLAQLRTVADPIERFVRAVANDYVIKEKELADNWHDCETQVLCESNALQALWLELPPELTGGHEHVQFTGVTASRVSSWFAETAQRQEVAPDEVLGWPTPRSRQRFERGYDEVLARSQYRPGPEVGVWHVPVMNPQDKTATGDELRSAMVAADGRLHIYLENTAGFRAPAVVKPGGRFGPVTVVFMAKRLGYSVTWTRWYGTQPTGNPPRVPWSRGYQYWLSPKESLRVAAAQSKAAQKKRYT